jgi:hypothetical protein
MLLLHEQITILPLGNRRAEKVYQISDDTYLWVCVENDGQGKHTVSQKHLTTDQYVVLLNKICQIKKGATGW